MNRHFTEAVLIKALGSLRTTKIILIIDSRAMTSLSFHGERGLRETLERSLTGGVPWVQIFRGVPATMDPAKLQVQVQQLGRVWLAKRESCEWVSCLFAPLKSLVSRHLTHPEAKHPSKHQFNSRRSPTTLFSPPRIS
jgi:hypothetical protein